MSDDAGAVKRRAIVILAALGLACAAIEPIPATCETGGDVPYPGVVRCARLRGSFAVAAGQRLPYGDVSLRIYSDSLLQLFQQEPRARLDASGRFDLRLVVWTTVSTPHDSIRTLLLYVRSRYWDLAPFDSTPITLHFVKVGDQLPLDTVRWVSQVIPGPL